jgi:hypothetical protein
MAQGGQFSVAHDNLNLALNPALLAKPFEKPFQKPNVSLFVLVISYK